MDVGNIHGTAVEWNPIHGDDKIDGSWLTGAFRVMKEGGAIYMHCRWDVEPQWREIIRAAGFKIAQRLTWDKGRFGGAGDLNGTYRPTCEDILFATKGRHELKFRPDMLISIPCIPSFRMRHHPHQKPQALAELFIGVSSKAGDLVYDPFCGSGTTLAAAQKLGRRWMGSEIDPRWAAIAKERMAEGPAQIMMTGHVREA